MDKDTALRLALEALENWFEFDPENFGEVDKKAITAIKAALEAKNEPVAYPEGDVVGPCICGSWPGGKCLKCPRTTPPQQEAKDEPVQVSECQVSHNHIWIEDLYKHQEKNT